MLDLLLPLFAQQAGYYLTSSILFAMFSYFLRHETNFGLDFLCSSINFDENDQIYPTIIEWMAQGNKAFRSLKYPLNGHGSRSSLDYPAQQDQGIASPIRYEPFLGTYFFWHKGRLFIFRRVRRAGYYESDHVESLSLETLGWSPEPIKMLVGDIRLWAKEKESKITNVWRPKSKTSMFSDIPWKKALSRPARPMESIILDIELKEKIIDDVKLFLDEGTRNWYASLGIPYRRGYLFHGPPGTGKTSLSFALAGLFGLDIFVIPLSDNQITDSNLKDLFIDLPEQCVVLLEDIDAEDLSKSRAALIDEDHQEHSRAHGVSYSGLLNAIDGVDSPEGRILIMTTNHPKVLDAALVRRGRVDLEVQFPQATLSDIAQLYYRMYPAEEKNLGLFSNMGDATLSMAEVQSVFLEHMKDAPAAVNALAALVKQKGEN
jgi:chaperone BCS1